MWSPTPMTMLSRSTPALGVPMELAQGITMERTPSGNSIMSEPPYPQQEPRYDDTFTDEQAARRVESHFYRRPSDRKHERILRKLVMRDDPLDEDALRSILTSADSVFFGGVLSGRVQWEWSSQDSYQKDLIGTTALRRRLNGDGFETLIVLSSPILRNPIYDRRLLLSAFLHELVHCYLFIMCGFGARFEGGHTDGFERIVTVIDNWVGKGHLYLCNFKANLDHFTKEVKLCRDDHGQRHDQRHDHSGCNQSPRPDSGLMDLGGVRPGYF